MEDDKRSNGVKLMQHKFGESDSMRTVNPALRVGSIADTVRKTASADRNDDETPSCSFYCATTGNLSKKEEKGSKRDEPCPI